MQNNMERNKRDADKSSGESPTNDERFMKMVEVTGNAYSEALRRLAEEESNDYKADIEKEREAIL